MVCPKCGFDSPQSLEFCGRCGTALIPSSRLHLTGHRYSPRGERRQLTVMFCDLVGSTALSGQLDPEELSDVIREYERACAQVIDRHEGHIAQFLGDGLLVYFGYPLANEDDAARAVHAGLEIVAAVAALRERLRKPLFVRAAVHTGLVVVGAVGGEANPDPMAISGQTPNIAARLLSIAGPGEVLITAATYRLIEGFFVCRSRGSPPLRGALAPMELFEVLEPTQIQTRFERAVVSGLTPLVGRDREVELLLRHWQESTQGRGQVVMLSGEPGIGKSRLLRVLKERTTGEWINEFEVGCSPYSRNSPLYPVINFLQNALQLKREDDTHRRLELLKEKLAEWDFSLLDAVPLFAAMLLLPQSDRYPALPMTPQRQKQKTLEAIVAFLLHAAERRPTRVIVEDLHWADPSTLELLELLIEQVPRARLFVALAFRPEFAAPWLAQPHITNIIVGRLSRSESESMICSVAEGKSLPGAATNEIATKTEGVPLLVEELTRAVLESGNANLSGRGIPVTLHDSLMARLDRLGPAKEVIQVGAVIGSEFSYALLHALLQVADDDLQHNLRSLTDAELLYVRGLAPEATYQFKHALIRDAAYEALLKSRRRDLHRLVAQTISDQLPALCQEQPEVLARHWAEAGETEQAIAEWSRAGKLARARGAFKEALDCFRQGLAMLELLPESSERDLRELAFRESFLLMLWMTRGPSSHETMEAVQRAVRVAEKTAKLASLVQIVVAGGWNLVAASPDVAAIQKLADQALEIARHEGGPASLLMAHSLQLQTCLFRGDLAGAENHFTATTGLVNDPSIKQKYNLFVVQGSYTAAMNAWMLGRLDLARERFAKVIATKDANNPYQLAASRVWAADFLWALRNYEQAEASAMQALELAEKNQFALVAATSKRILGSSRVGLGRANEGVELIREAIADALEIGCAQRGFFNKTFLAAARAGEGAIDDALETIEQALEDNPDEAFFLPTTLALRGDLRIKQGQNELAEADFREALGRARSMGGKMLELRAAMSLARLLDQQQRRNEARELLAEIYDWFTEGFDTADLKEAKALLDELNG